MAKDGPQIIDRFAATDWHSACRAVAGDHHLTAWLSRVMLDWHSWAIRRNRRAYICHTHAAKIRGRQHRNTTREILGKLESAGLIQVYRGHAAAGWRGPGVAIYRIVWDAVKRIAKSAPRVPTSTARAWRDERRHHAARAELLTHQDRRRQFVEAVNAATEAQAVSAADAEATQAREIAEAGGYAAYINARRAAITARMRSL